MGKSTTLKAISGNVTAQSGSITVDGLKVKKDNFKELFHNRLAMLPQNPQALFTEITAEEDCVAMLKAGWCGVSLLATAHASDCEDLKRRCIYQPLARSGLFTQAVVLSRDKTWRMERMTVCT